MSEKTDQMRAKIEEGLKNLEQRLTGVKADLEAAGDKTRAAFGERLEEAKGRLEAGRKDVEEARTRIAAYVEEKKGETSAAIEDWKTQRRVDKLERRAERAEEYALKRILVALENFEEAEVATLDAIIARVEVDEAASAA